MPHASHREHVLDLIVDLRDIYDAQLQILQQYADQPTGRLEQVLRDREQMRADLYRQLEQAALAS